MNRPIRAWALVVAAVAIACLVVLVVVLGTDPTQHQTMRIGEPAPKLVLSRLDGTTIRSADLRGKVVVVNFWNSWCPPCRAEVPTLRAFYIAHEHDPDFLMIGIVRDDSRRAIRTYVEAHDIRWTSAFDPNGKASIDFGTRGQPETYVINPKGTLVAALIGPATSADLEQMLQSASGNTRP